MAEKEHMTSVEADGLLLWLLLPYGFAAVVFVAAFVLLCFAVVVVAAVWLLLLCWGKRTH